MAREPSRDIESTLPTWGSLVKVLAGAAVLVGWTIGIYAWVSDIGSRQRIFEVQVKAEIDTLSAAMKGMQERQTQNEKVTSELTVAVQKATLVLERLDRKLGSP